MTITDPSEHPELEDRFGGEVPLKVLQECSAEDVAGNIRFLYRGLQARLAVRERSVESLLRQEYEIGTRLYEVVRAYGCFNEVGEKKHVLARSGINLS
jgi:hypothetical protein